MNPFERFNDIELPACKHCGRVVLAGPPCCNNKIRDLYIAAQQEVQWLRKIQSKQTKRIEALKKDRSTVQVILSISVVVLIVCLFFLIKGG